MGLPVRPASEHLAQCHTLATTNALMQMKRKDIAFVLPSISQNEVRFHDRGRIYLGILFGPAARATYPTYLSCQTPIPS